MSHIVSVIIPCYNSEQYVGHAIESVLSQTYKNIECIIVDDGSEDRSAEIIRMYENNDKRVKYLLKENGGVSSARNYGVKHAQGKWIQFLDSDDMICVDKIEQQLLFLNDKTILNKYILVYSDYMLFWEDENNSIVNKKEIIVGHLTKDQIINLIVNRKFGTMGPLSLNSVLLSSNIFEKYNLNENEMAYEDNDFFYRILHDDIKCFYVPLISMLYRQRSSSASKSNILLSRKGYLQYLETIYTINKKHLESVPNFKNLLEVSISKNDKEMFNKILWLIKNGSAPVYVVFNGVERNISKLVIYLDNIRICYIVFKIIFLFRRLKHGVRRSHRGNGESDNKR